jgi:hypothetical protein
MLFSPLGTEAAVATTAANSSSNDDAARLSIKAACSWSLASSGLYNNGSRSNEFDRVVRFLCLVVGLQMSLTYLSHPLPLLSHGEKGFSAPLPLNALIKLWQHARVAPRHMHILNIGRLRVALIVFTRVSVPCTSSRDGQD